MEVSEPYVMVIKARPREETWSFALFYDVVSTTMVE
jgi:hypothetical protein